MLNSACVFNITVISFRIELEYLAIFIFIPNLHLSSYIPINILLSLFLPFLIALVSCSFLRNGRFSSTFLSLSISSVVFSVVFAFTAFLFLFNGLSLHGVHSIYTPLIHHRRHHTFVSSSQTDHGNFFLVTGRLFSHSSSVDQKTQLSHDACNHIREISYY